MITINEDWDLKGPIVPIEKIGKYAPRMTVLELAPTDEITTNGKKLTIWNAESEEALKN